MDGFQASTAGSMCELGGSQLDNEEEVLIDV
jgi:hypothetical protein